MSASSLKFTNADDPQDDPTMDTNSLAVRLCEDLKTLSRQRKRQWKPPRDQGGLVDVHYKKPRQSQRKRRRFSIEQSATAAVPNTES